MITKTVSHMSYRTLSTIAIVGLLLAATVGMYFYNQPTFVAYAEQDGQKVFLSAEQRGCPKGQQFVRYVGKDTKVDGCALIVPPGVAVIEYEDKDSGLIPLSFFKPLDK